MIIQVERSGGFLGFPMRARVDTRILSDEERRAVETLVSDADFFGLPERIPASGSAPDRFLYAVSVDDGERSHATMVGETDAPPRLRDLIQQVMVIARSTRG